MQPKEQQRKHLYIGKAGQFVIMSEFLARGWNVAVPEVDVGDDIFVVRDEIGDFSRIQVKTAHATARKNGFSAQFNLPIEQLRRLTSPELTYCFMIRFEDEWQKPIIIKRQTLQLYHESENLGSLVNDNLILYFSRQDSRLICSKIDLSEYVNDFKWFPSLFD
jgi:hypothetical protein